MAIGMTLRRLVCGGLLILIVYVPALPVQAATYTSPRQLNVFDVYQLNPDGASGDEETTCPKIDLNDGASGDNPYFRRFNVARAHLGGCPERYWYTSEYRSLCTDVPPVNTCPGQACMDEPDPNGEQYVDYAPPFGAGAQQLTPGRYVINAQYRYTASRPTYPVVYTVHSAGGGVAVINQRQDQGTLGACESFDLGMFDLDAGSYIRVEDTGPGSITFNRMRFTYMGPLGGVPYVNAGMDQTIILPAPAALDGTVADDGQPAPLVATWSKLSGPGTVTFADEHAVDTTATFSEAGAYVLRLTATDTVNTVNDDVAVNVLPVGSFYRYSTQYEFDDAISPDPSTATGVMDADPNDANGAGLLTKVGNGVGDAPGGFSSGIMHFVDNTTSGSRGFYWQNNGGNISLTIDMRVKANATTTGTLSRRAMGFSGGNGKNRGMRVSYPGSATCPNGSVTFNATNGTQGPEGCVPLSDFRRLRVTVNTVTNKFRAFDLDNRVELTSTDGGGSGPADQILNKGGFHIGSLSSADTTMTDFELDYFRVLLGTAVEDATTQIADLLCGEVFADADRDNDVDQEDFGIFQQCVTGANDPGLLFNSAACSCFDRNGDKDVDELDYGVFQDCASGPDVPFNPCCDGGAGCP